MSKIIYFLVIVAIIAQAYAVPADPESEAKSAVNNAEKQADSVKPPSSAGEAGPGLASFVDPLFNFGKGAIDQGQKTVDGLFKNIPGK